MSTNVRDLRRIRGSVSELPTPDESGRAAACTCCCCCSCVVILPAR